MILQISCFCMKDGVVGKEFAQHFRFSVSSHSRCNIIGVVTSSLINFKCFNGITLRWELKNLKRVNVFILKVIINCNE